MSATPRPSRDAAAGARTLRWQGAANRLVRVLLRTPLVARVVGRKLITIYVVGRRTGRRYHVPVAYTPHEGDLLVGTSFTWARNLTTGEPVDILLRGRRRTVDVQVFTAEPDVVARYAVIARSNHNFAAFNRIGLDESGDPNPADLHLAWTAGARAIQLTERGSSARRPRS